MESRFDRRELLFQPRGIPPLGTSLSLALQHLVAMIVGCVTPPIIIAGAIGLSQEEQVLLIQASLVMSAVCTFLQLYPIGGRFGSGLPVILGVSFAYVPSMQAIAASGGGVAAIAGAMIVGGIVAVLVAVKGYEPYYNVERGTFRVVNDEGANSWTPDGKGKDLRLIEKVPAVEMAVLIENYMMHQPVSK